ncbi:Glu-tRNA(Gln) amidotransferase subunit GatE [Fervidicoccus fontis]|uniref:Glutamyl-tRNA(Gln) amidotransferase subunit E n=2 Tax=Fervidicoccus fontis TaxID=683846 RepID=I0A2J7_FERFK|nr:Glu-tRNA(Gln) amidotransferase subunit GatE [Fervidicoccus fontis]AFH43204.1 glutamyl-tRNA(Gln) amidotransferase subunit E [Fervidicoccus fontis Kam940]PMB75924.1 MAG: Glu-tRNA(Gln) amidotransferase GatDE subunit E [Fervidicoccus fontis]PMB77413.1 MAG: Glu-tRNA(Gln) amidotransferase GatDE subunit E [Fervidicoccus fontis]
MESSNNEIDFRKIGLKVGLEIHQQLKTERKLFCNCPISSEEGREELFERSLRPTTSEFGEVDIAAYFEWKKGRRYRYHAPHPSSCLVEADEEPPHEINREALEVVIGISKALGSIPVDEVHVMRKIVIDGSNTSGFQRTMLVSIGGRIEVEGKSYRIQTICLEEDAARKGEDEGNISHYIIDRLGIPLIEIATAPDIETPEEAQKVALYIGQLLRLSGKVKRGIGTIRQDLNISIEGGEKVEIKGVQELKILAKTVELEAMRQLRLLEIREELKKRGLSEQDVKLSPIDVTDILKRSQSKIVRANLSKPKGKALAQILHRFKGILGTEVQPNRRFGTELADYARFYGDVRGLFHSDELPNYGISKEEVEMIYNALGADREKDAFVLIVDEESKALKSMEAVINRVKYAFKGIPKETRVAMPDGTTKFLRPQPGAARMYPETDIPPIIITEEIMKSSEKYTPQTPEKKKEYYIKELGLSRALAEQMVMNESFDFFDELVEEFKGSIEPTTIASIMLVTMPALKREGLNVELIPERSIREIFSLFARRMITREGIEELLKQLSKKPEEKPEKIAKELGLLSLGEEEVRKIIEKVVEENMNVIREKGEKAEGILMGKAMQILRGKAPGSLVSKLIREKLSEILSKS